MSRLGVALMLTLATVAALLLREVVTREYHAWAGWVARALCRVAGRLAPRMREEWWADVVQVQADRGESGLGFALTALLSGVRFAVGTAARRGAGKRLTPEPEADAEPEPLLEGAPVAEAVLIVPGSPFPIPPPKSSRETSGELGRRVRALRCRAELSQQELAVRAHMHRTYIGSLERGERDLTFSNIVRLAAALGVSPADLVRGLGRVESGPQQLGHQEGEVE